MPPRKKTAPAVVAAAADGTSSADAAPATKATRSSARQKAQASTSQSQGAAASSQTQGNDNGSMDVDGKKVNAKTTKTAPASKAKTAAAKPPSKTAATLKDSKPASKAASKPASTARSKGKGKRTRDEVSDEEPDDHANDEDDEDDKTDKKGKGKAKKPASKKAKVDPIAEDDEEEEEEKKKMVTVIKRGAAPVDPCSGLVLTHQVYANAEGVWDAMLNQTDIGKNANKFYVIQLLHPVGNPSSCTLFTRWGRVGENGQQQKKGPFAANVAVSEFKKQFKAKAATDWEKRHGMVAKKGKYTWIERSFEEEPDESDKPKSKKGKSKDTEEEDEKIPDSTLASEVQELCRLIFSIKLMDAHLESMNYDAHKLPLGKLAKSTILNGFAALKILSEVIANPNCDAAREHGGYRSAVETLTGRYYSIIPHDFGRNRPTVIDDTVRLKRELDLVDALGDMEIASKLIASTVSRDAQGLPINPIDAHFRSLNLSSMDPIQRSSVEFDQLQTYVKNTHGQTHHIRVQVLNAFRVERQDETDAWLKAGNDKLSDGERLLLWHGSRTTNFAGILKQGLRIAPPEAPATGYMFGKGVYFADMMSKSANYCYAYLSDNTGLLLLAEVAARPYYELKQSDYRADVGCKNAGARATKGLGRTQPGEWQDAGHSLGRDDLKGVWMPKGTPVQQNDAGLVLQYNEYIVYDPSQIRLRYLLMVKMD